MRRVAISLNIFLSDTNRFFYKDKGKHIVLHILLLIGNIPIQLLVNGLHPSLYHFSLSPLVRILDTLICYSIMLLIAFVYLKVSKCMVKSLVYYAVIGVISCIIIAYGLEWVEFWQYESEFCSNS